VLCKKRKKNTNGNFLWFSLRKQKQKQKKSDFLRCVFEYPPVGILLGKEHSSKGIDIHLLTLKICPCLKLKWNILRFSEVANFF
jgi:hypothetical protein